MQSGTKHSEETRNSIRLTQLQKSMPADEFDQYVKSNGALKWCNRCKSLLPVNEFHKSKRYDGWYCLCKKCNSTRAQKRYQDKAQDPEFLRQQSERSKEWAKTNPEYRRALEKKRNLKRYGLTVAQFDEMLKSQNHRCAICDDSIVGKRAVHVDHDHQTNQVRGLLCNSCNNGLGRFRDDPSRLRRAANYLEQCVTQL